MQYDFSLSKSTKMGESFVSELHWEGYNVFNSPVFSNPASAIIATGPGTAGLITSTISGPRTMQVGLRVRS